MKFTVEDARRYEAWFMTPIGHYSLQKELGLIRAMVSPWPKRGRRLLEVGCGTGVFLEQFWHDGFDVSGMDKSQAMVEAARNRLGNKADIHVGDGAHLPFTDNEYDYCALITCLEFGDEPEMMIKEAARVASDGIMIAFLNKWSLYYLSHGHPWPWSKKNTLRQATWFSWPKIRSMVKNQAPEARCKLKSVLPGPKFSWQQHKFANMLNSPHYPMFMGSFCVARFDFTPIKPLTPITAKPTLA